MMSVDRHSSVASVMSRAAKTARPAVGVWRISKRLELGVLTGRSLADGEVGGAEEEEEGRDVMVAVRIDGQAEEGPSESMATVVDVSFY